MSDQALIYTSLTACLALLGLMYISSRGRSIHFFVASFFALFSLGPVVNYITGASIFAGIRPQYIGRATFGFAVAIAALALSQVLSRARRRRGAVEVRPAAEAAVTKYPLVYLALGVLIVYGLIGVAALAPVFTTGSKIQSLQVSGSSHYVYLLAELAAVSAFFMLRRDRLGYQLWIANACVYVAYCLITFERDFLFVFFSVFLHYQLFSRKHSKPGRLVLAGLASAAVATVLFAQRGDSEVSVAGLLNQGSVLFVDTFVMSLVPVQLAFASGTTYVSALASVAPSWLYDSKHVGLSEWLVGIYAPGSPSGYGFSLTGEAYLNFGYYGIFGAFLVLGLVLGGLSRRFARSDWASYASVYYATIFMYAIRGDSEQVLKSMLYGGLFFVVVTSLRNTDVGEGAGRPPAAEAGLRRLSRLTDGHSLTH
ncbi:MAG TPA: O-antigen polysaccharide polymerase Wzy [Dermatophilaceae bacterium]|nr:O-antigen polysaccharide polymerase Wzy [Dermatophilaceae bacterium]